MSTTPKRRRVDQPPENHNADYHLAGAYIQRHVPNDWKLDFNFVLTMGHNIDKPLVVRLDGIDRQGGQLAIQGRELVILERQTANLGRANGSEVCWVRKEDRPLALFPFMKGFKGALGGICGKVGDNVS